MIQRPGNIPGYPPAGMTGRTRRPVYPTTGDEFTAYTGITLTSLYLFNEASGNLIDQVGANDLTVANDPTFAYASENRRGVNYDELDDAHRADVCGLGSGSGMYGTVFRSIADLGSNHVIGRLNSPITESCDIDIPTGTNNLRAVIRDDASGSVLPTISTVSARARTYLAIIQIDRANTTARLGMYWPGGYVEATASIAGFGSLDGASQTFGFGQDGAAARQGGCANFLGFVATGAQCEGASTPLSIARGLGWA